ncbi:MAG: type II toxin-antitoxin system VapC family toxin [Acidiferrobacterales bacterium]|nr:type II toxin-antitoxin system VapC family toxin [Acidiferrobacterales bacterium]
MSNLLLDTCAVVWIGMGETIDKAAMEQINEAYHEDGKVCMSPITAWELAALANKERIRLARSVLDWFESFAAQDGITMTLLSPRILVNSWELPGTPPNDPADRIMISTARTLNLSIVTRDKPILDYSSQGHVQAIHC